MSGILQQVQNPEIDTQTCIIFLTLMYQFQNG